MSLTALASDRVSLDSDQYFHRAMRYWRLHCPGYRRYSWLVVCFSSSCMWPLLIDCGLYAKALYESPLTSSHSTWWKLSPRRVKKQTGSTTFPRRTKDVYIILIQQWGSRMNTAAVTDNWTFQIWELDIYSPTLGTKFISKLWETCFYGTGERLLLSLIAVETVAVLSVPTFKSDCTAFWLEAVLRQGSAPKLLTDGTKRQSLPAVNFPGSVRKSVSISRYRR